jgi:hypothetical protein
MFVSGNASHTLMLALALRALPLGAAGSLVACSTEAPSESEPTAQSPAWVEDYVEHVRKAQQLRAEINGFASRREVPLQGAHAVPIPATKPSADVEAKKAPPRPALADAEAVDGKLLALQERVNENNLARQRLVMTLPDQELDGAITSLAHKLEETGLDAKARTELLARDFSSPLRNSFGHAEARQRFGQALARGDLSEAYAELAVGPYLRATLRAGAQAEITEAAAIWAIVIRDALRTVPLRVALLRKAGSVTAFDELSSLLTLTRDSDQALREAALHAITDYVAARTLSDEARNAIFSQLDLSALERNTDKQTLARALASLQLHSANDWLLARFSADQELLLLIAERQPGLNDPRLLRALLSGVSADSPHLLSTQLAFERLKVPPETLTVLRSDPKARSGLVSLGIHDERR